MKPIIRWINRPEKLENCIINNPVLQYGEKVVVYEDGIPIGEEIVWTDVPYVEVK